MMIDTFWQLLEEKYRSYEWTAHDLRLRKLITEKFRAVSSRDADELIEDFNRKLNSKLYSFFLF